MVFQNYVAMRYDKDEDMLIIVCCQIGCFIIILHTINIEIMTNESVLILFGKNVQRLRKSKWLSQEQLAEIAGLHRTYIGMIERAEKNITLINIKKIAVALNVKLTDLLQ